MAATIDIAGVIDWRTFGRFHATVVGLPFLLMLADGFGLAGAASGALRRPELELAGRVVAT